MRPGIGCYIHSGTGRRARWAVHLPPASMVVAVRSVLLRGGDARGAHPSPSRGPTNSLPVAAPAQPTRAMRPCRRRVPGVRLLEPPAPASARPVGPRVRLAPARLVPGVRPRLPEAERRPHPPPLRDRVVPAQVVRAPLARIAPSWPRPARPAGACRGRAAPACDGEAAIRHGSSPRSLVLPHRVPTAVADREAAAGRHGACGFAGFVPQRGHSPPTF